MLYRLHRPILERQLFQLPISLLVRMGRNASGENVMLNVDFDKSNLIKSDLSNNNR